MAFIPTTWSSRGQPSPYPSLLLEPNLELMERVVNYKEYSCPQCIKPCKFIDIKKFEDHVRMRHPKSNVKPTILTTQHYYCNMCDKAIMKPGPVHVCQVRRLKCMGCMKKCATPYEFYKHSYVIHCDSLEFFYFPRKNEFVAWQENMQLSTKCKYQTQFITGPAVTSLPNVMYFCNSIVNEGGTHPCLIRCPSFYFTMDFGDSVQVYFNKDHAHPHKTFDTDIYKTFMPTNVCTTQSNVDLVKSYKTDVYLKFQTLIDSVKIEAAKLDSKRLEVLYNKCLDIVYIQNCLSAKKDGSLRRVSPVLGKRVSFSKYMCNSLDDVKTQDNNNLVGDRDSSEDDDNFFVKTDNGTDDVLTSPTENVDVKTTLVSEDIEETSPFIVNTFTLNRYSDKFGTVSNWDEDSETLSTKSLDSNISQTSEADKNPKDYKTKSSYNVPPVILPQKIELKKPTFNDQFSDFIKQNCPKECNTLPSKAKTLTVSIEPSNDKSVGDKVTSLSKVKTIREVKNSSDTTKSSLRVYSRPGNNLVPTLTNKNALHKKKSKIINNKNTRYGRKRANLTNDAPTETKLTKKLNDTAIELELNEAAVKSEPEDISDDENDIKNASRNKTVYNNTKQKITITKRIKHRRRQIRRNVKKKLKLKSTVIGSGKIVEKNIVKARVDEYEVMEQENDCNILILKI